MGEGMGSLLLTTMAVNAGLAVFNLLPIPPLDGSRVLYGLLPPRLGPRYARLVVLAPLFLIAFLAVPAP